MSPSSRPDVAIDAERLPGTATHHPSGRYLNRELSWLDFNARVLALAERRSLPLLERVKFLAIFSSNLDEFFQVRVGGLKMQLEARKPATGPDEAATDERLNRIGSCVHELTANAGDVFAQQLVPELAAAGIRLARWDDLDDAERGFLDGMFDEEILPLLTPLAVDPAHPFPYISNLSLNLAVVGRAPGELTRRIARVKMPTDLPRFVVLPDGGRFVPVEEVVARHLSALFPAYGDRRAFPVPRDPQRRLRHRPQRR
jgi:polyphosphate kinase